MSQLNDISLVAQVVVFKNTRAFDQLVQKYQSPVRRFFLHLTFMTIFAAERRWRTWIPGK